MTLIRGLLLTLALVVVACAPSTAPEDVGRREALVGAVRDAAPCDAIDLQAVLGHDWDRAVFLGPYATNAGAKEALGFEFDIESVSPWTNTEGGTVVVLAKGREAVAWFSVSSDESGLHDLDYASISAPDLRFTAVDDATGFRELVPTDTAGC